MLLVQRYSLEIFITPRRFYYPRVVIEFYHTMTSRQEPNPTTIHFSIDGRPGILRVSDIATAFHLLVVIGNSTDYRQWPHTSTGEMVRLLAWTRQPGPSCSGGSYCRVCLIDHILRSNLFPLQHIVQRRGAILEALYHISEGY